MIVSGSAVVHSSEPKKVMDEMRECVKKYLQSMLT